MRSRALVIATATATLALGACSESPVSFVVLSLQSATVTAIPGVDKIRVSVAKGQTQMRVLTYDGKGATIDQVTMNTLSVGFSSGESGLITFDVDAMNAAGCTVGHGTASKDIAVGAVATATVSLAAGTMCVPDGGVPDSGGPEGGVLPGCDPVNPSSTSAGTMCTATQTCQVNCMPASGAPPRNECTPGGSGAPGTTCNSNADCQPGTQCFNYAVTGCATKVCLRFCNTNQDCAAFGAGGGGPGSFCEGPVMCPSFLTAYNTCTFNCDPRAAAAATRGGCPGALACVMPGSMDQVDCACPEATRTKRENEACTGAADCAPGLLCNMMATTRVCRPICRCDANAAGTCTSTTNDCPTTGTVCRPLTNNTIYGICL